MNASTKEKNFIEVKSSIDEAIEGFKETMPELYAYLKESIIMNEENSTFMYKTKE